MDSSSSSSPYFYIGYSERKGRGLYAKIDIEPFTIIHIAPCIVIVQDEYNQYMQHTILEHYLFNDVTTGNKLLALGYGSLFNHDSKRPNTIYHVVRRKQSNSEKANNNNRSLGESLTNETKSSTAINDNEAITIEYKSGVQRILKDTELCISYGSNLWFSDDDEINNNQNHNSEEDISSESDNEEFLNRITC